MDNWKFIYKDFKPEEEPLREALCTLGNGYFATRGAAEDSTESDVHYPGTYIAGGYNRLTSKIAGKNIENEDLVNWPNWLFLTFRLKGGKWFSTSDVEMLDYEQVIDVKHGMVNRKMRFRHDGGKETTISSKRIVSMANMHLAGIEWTFIPENWSGEIIIRSGLDGNVQNNGVERYNDLRGDHLAFLSSGRKKEDIISLEVQAKTSKILVAQAARTRVSGKPDTGKISRKIYKNKGFISDDITLECEKINPIKIEKIVTVYTSRDWAISEPVHESVRKLNYINDFTEILEDHMKAWKGIWQRSDINLKSKTMNQFVIRLHIFHLFQTVCENTIDLDTGVPSRGLHGEAYRGHIFWDELYIFPFLIYHMPQLTRALLMYRYRRMNEARRAAHEAGYRGAMFPWQSGSNGREESQEIHLNPKSGRWIPDETYLQRHINSDIVYNIWQYYQITNDTEFLAYYGAEMIFNIALFWSSKAEFNPKKNRFEIKGVVGPDEYHTRYPGTDRPGLNNNAYTNFMVAWVMVTAAKVIDMLDESKVHELFSKTGINEEDVDKWGEMCRKMYIPFQDEECQIIDQFEGFSELKELDWKKYHDKYGKVMRLDRILENENDSPNNYKASKQADVLMLFYLFSSEELISIFHHLGYDFKPEFIHYNIEYYEEITSHGSTLSQLIHSWVHSRSDRKRSWKSFRMALMSDFKDVQGGTTPEGIHLGAMAGTIDLMQRCYTGLDARDDVLWINPSLPDDLNNIHIHIRFRSYWISINIMKTKLILELDRSPAKPIHIGFAGEIYEMNSEDKKEFKLVTHYT